MNDLRKVGTHEVVRTNIGKIIGAVIIALVIGAIGVYTYENGMWKSPPKQIVPANDLPSPGPVINVPARPGPQP